MAKQQPARRQVVGLRDIAEELNVSVSLVSKVLSGRLGTSGANIKKIRAIRAKARELGYQKNLLAEALRTGRQNVLALFLHRHGEPGSGIVDETINGVAEEAARSQQRLAIHYYESAEEFRHFASRMHRNVVDGVIVAGVPHAEIAADLAEMHTRGIPVVTIHDAQIDPQLPNVGMDQREVTRQATLHLIDRGCRRIAHLRITGTASLGASRFEGYRSALIERGLPVRQELVIDVRHFNYEAGQAAVKRLLEGGPAKHGTGELPFDGLVCQADTQGVAAINELVLRGVRVPEQVKVIGVDNAPFCRYAIVPLSSVSQEFNVRGQRAAQLLMDCLHDRPVESVQIAPVVSPRASTAVAREGKARQREKQGEE